MTTPQDMDGDRDDILAAEYVLGVLSASDHMEAQHRLDNEAAFASKVQFWQHNMSALDVDYQPVQPPNMFGKIEARLFGQPARAGFGWLWNSARLWRSVAAVAVVSAGLVIGVSLFQIDNTPPAQDANWIANLSAANSPAEFLALYDGRSKVLRLTGVAGDEYADKDYELWIIPKDQNPISLGVVPVAGLTQIELAEELQTYVDAESVLAVTLEPLGGAPQGIPTGELVAAGNMVLI